jgi:hypothetical protein
LNSNNLFAERERRDRCCRSRRIHRFGFRIIYMRGIRAIELPPPPPKYDHPYAGKVTIKHDMAPIWAGDHESGGFFIADTEPPKRPGGECVIHTLPLWEMVQNKIMEPVGLARVNPPRDGSL